MEIKEYGIFIIPLLHQLGSFSKYILMAKTSKCLFGPVHKFAFDEECSHCFLKLSL